MKTFQIILPAVFSGILNGSYGAPLSAVAAGQLLEGANAFKANSRIANDPGGKMVSQKLTEMKMIL
jgi:hypothetical protein